MGRLRSVRKRAIVSSDEGEEDFPVGGEKPESSDQDDGQPDTTNSNGGKLKPVKKSGNPPNLNAPGQKGKTRKSPVKSKAANAKTRPSSTAQAENNVKPIYSFFNAATQSRKVSQPPADPPKLSVPPDEELDFIQDDSDDGNPSTLNVSKGSSTVLAVHKRKVQHSETYEDGRANAQIGSHKFYKTNQGSRIPSIAVINNDKRPWTDQFAPKDLSELAVHKRKVDDVRQWLESSLNSRRHRVLVLKGAAGTGKTTTIKLLARELGIDILEWRSPEGSDPTGEGSASYAAQFADFVGRAGRSGGLQFDVDRDMVPAPEYVEDETAQSNRDKSQLLIVEEFPSTFSRTSNTLQAFRSSILQHLSTPLANNEVPIPTVMVISETLLSTNTPLSDSFTAHRLLGPELTSHPYLNMIEFNAVAPTILLKALQTIVVKEARISGRRKTPGTQVLKHLAEAGDIRSAVSSLEFLCLRGDEGDTWSSKVSFTKPKKARQEPGLTTAEVEALKLVTNRESTLGIFHSVGKVVYNKRVEPTASDALAQPPPWFPQHRRIKVPENDIDRLIDELGTDTTTFFAALHENYALSCQAGKADETLESLSSSMDNISDADLLSIDRFSYGTRSFSGSATDSLRQDEMAFQVAVRGLWFSLPSPVNRITPSDGKRGDAHRMFYPASMRIWKKGEEVGSVLDLLVSRIGNSARLVSGKASSETGGARGVESWRRSNNFDSESDGSTAQAPESSPSTMNSAKLELLLERLPYMALISSPQSAAAGILNQINTVTRVRNASNAVKQEDEADVNEEDAVDRETWTTDRPDGEAEAGSSKTRKRTEKPKPWAAQSLPEPVETSVGNLVLEDDDIVDD